MLRQLEAVLCASRRVISFEIIDNDPIDSENLLLKLRCEVTSGQSLQIRIRVLAGVARYSYQEFADRPLRRWDNAPHFPQLTGFPNHYHDPEGNVTVSSLTGEPITDLQLVLEVL